MRFSGLVLVIVVGLAFTPLPALGATISLTATMDCAQANAGAGTCGTGGSGTGSATVTLDDSTNLLSWTVTWNGLSAATILAHFHGPATPAQNAGIEVGITASSPSVGSATIDASQAADLLNELWYLNIHSSAFPGGEIRGQVTVVPEPATALLLTMGLAGLAARRRWQH